MAGVGAFGLADRSRLRAGAGSLCVVLGLAGFGTGVGAAQEDKVPTLHAYSNLVQVPTLVLDKALQPMAPIAERRFFVRFDGGPRFRVTHARLEGDDPISLAILLDVRQPFPLLMEKFDAAAGALAPLSLTARDHVSIYSVGCNLVRSVGDAPADSATLQQGVEQALLQWRARAADREKGGCQSPWNLWDALTSVTHGMREARGRRVILAVTDGVDRGSKNTWSGLREDVQEDGVAIFGLMRAVDVFGSFHSGFPSNKDNFGSLCEVSGGMVMVGTEKTVAEGLKQFASLVRGRYIVEFPRPFSTTTGIHEMNITIDKMDAEIRPAGVSVPVDDPEILNSPNTVPSDRSNAPTLGKPRVTH